MANIFPVFLFLAFLVYLVLAGICLVHNFELSGPIWNIYGMMGKINLDPI